MDGAAVSRIERWTRQLLEAEARKRGIRDPEVRSRSELLWAIAQHDYGARQSLRNARKLVGSLIQGATQALPMFARRSSAQHATLPVPGADTGDAWQAADEAHAAAFLAVSQPLAAALVASPGLQLGAAAEPSSLQLRRADGQLELAWQVNEQDAQRARTLLGQHGELSLRIVCVQADPKTVVRSSVTEHGPLAASGAWTCLLPGPESHCVGSIGVRHGDRFVSIAHESSRVPLGSGI
jgi:hypothetical protein